MRSDLCFPNSLRQPTQTTRLDKAERQVVAYSFVYLYCADHDHSGAAGPTSSEIPLALKWIAAAV